MSRAGHWHQPLNMLITNGSTSPSVLDMQGMGGCCSDRRTLVAVRRLHTPGAVTRWHRNRRLCHLGKQGAALRYGIPAYAGLQLGLESLTVSIAHNPWLRKVQRLNLQCSQHSY